MPPPLKRRSAFNEVAIIHTQKSSSKHNHALATWAMELSYAAYNYPDDTELPDIPGSFMGDVVDTAADVLTNHGFGNIIEPNYTSADCGAHTIAYRDIEYVTQNENITEEVTNYNGSDTGMVRSTVRGNLYAGLYNIGSDTGSSQLTNTKQLVVVAIRGSVTDDDWDNNFKTQFVPWDNEFAIIHTQKSSSKYNHALATWAMELSYTAYNYPEGDPLFFIPGAFMGDVDKPATTFLTEHGFENIRDYNYDHDDSVAHVVAHKNIEFSALETTQENTEGDNIDGLSYNDTRTYASNSNIVRLSDYVYNSSNIVTDIDPVSANQGLFSSVTSTASSSEESVSSDTRPLVVVDIRGSVTILDFILDLSTQLHNKLFEFEDGADDVIETLCGYEGCTECTAEDENCDCRGYLNNINNPIILVTGHSLGAAVANLVAAKLNAKVNQGDIQADVYAYTFATPTVKSSTTGDATTRYTNIFNILNTNDVVTYLPNSLLVPDTNLWSRHGIDIPINMPYDGLLSELFDTGPIGLFSHSMAVYMKWLEDNPNMTYDGLMEEVAEAKARGLLPKLLKAACPIVVTVKDSEGNIIAYESQQEGITYPEITDTGIVSWIDDDGDNLIWTIQIVFVRGVLSYDVAVKVGYNWYRTENVFAITVT